MAFSLQTVIDAFNAAKGKCKRCGKQLSWNNRGRSGRGCWEAHHKNSNGPDTLSNCEILCFECHTNTRSFGW